jgi:hypothetical protein
LKKFTNQYYAYLLRKSVRGNSRKHPHQKVKINRFIGRKSYTHTYVFVDAPAKFSLQFENSENVTGFIHKLKAIALVNSYIHIDLKAIDSICDGSISMLLSVIIDLSTQGKIIKGTYPDNLEARNIFEKSGFFKYMKGWVDPKNAESKNTIIRTGDNKTPPEEVSEQILNSMETIWGIKGRNPLLRGGVFEMVRNSCDHAFRDTEKIFWHFSITHHEESKSVSYSFVDNGKGIMQTLKRKGVIEKINHYFTDKSEILETAYKNGIQSRTGLPWRGKGLPTIYELYEDKVVRNLIVISNDVFIDFERNLRMELKSPFSGTYYHWVIDPSCTKYCFQ